MESAFGGKRFEGCIAAWDGEECEVCGGKACEELGRVGEACYRGYQETPYDDQTFVVTFDGTSCSIDVAAGVLGRDS